MKQQTRTFNQNFKGELFYGFEDVKSDLEKITKGLVTNFASGDYVAVQEFGRGVKSKAPLKDLVYRVYDEQQVYVNGKEKKSNDHSGIYLFATKEDSVFNYEYVGISQQVITRINQHTCHKNKSSATWAYLMAKYNDNISHGRVSDVTKNNLSKKRISEAIYNEQLAMNEKYYVTFFPVDDNFLMHLVEPYIASALGCFWNSFETH